MQLGVTPFFHGCVNFCTYPQPAGFPSAGLRCGSKLMPTSSRFTPAPKSGETSANAAHPPRYKYKGSALTSYGGRCGKES